MKMLKLEPAFKDYLWGGTRLKTEYNKKSDLDIVAESWELSTHPAGQSVIRGGEYDGLTLTEYIEKAGRQVLGKNGEAFENFPVLIKFIDAKNPLSIQVHPSDEYALRVEHEYGKTEMWYILDCDEGASLYFGVNREISKEEFRAKIEDNTLLEVLNKVPVHKGDVFFIEAGTIHAIGAGIIICEIQQNSNTTYRVYDYGRRDKDGNLRELHVDKAIEVSKMTPSDTSAHTFAPEQLEASVKTRLATCKYFTTDKFVVNGTQAFAIDDSSFRSFVIVDGEGTMESDGETLPVCKGDSVFVPAGNGTVTVTGDCTVILTTV